MATIAPIDTMAATLDEQNLVSPLTVTQTVTSPMGTPPDDGGGGGGTRAYGFAA